jgi:hypothetical protein
MATPARMGSNPVLVVKAPHRLLNLLLGIAALTWCYFIPVCFCSLASAPEEMSFKLTVNETTSAKTIAERALAEKRLAPAYFVQAEVSRDKMAEQEGRAERKVLVTHYQIEGDLTILTTVNLAKNAAESVETIAHLPTPLSEEEFKMAREMGLADSKVKEALGKDIEKVKVEALVLRTMAESDPIFGHRVVSLLFRLDKNYLSAPVVMVDLTTKKVTVENAKR